MGTLGKILSSKTVWGATLLGVMGILPTVAPLVPAGTKTGALITLVLAAFTIYGRIRAKQPLGPVIDETIAKTVDAVHELGIGPSTDAVSKVIQVQAVKAQIADTDAGVAAASKAP